MPFTPIDWCHLRTFLGATYAYLEVPFTRIFVDFDGFCFVLRVRLFIGLTVNTIECSRAVFKVVSQHVCMSRGTEENHENLRLAGLHVEL